MSDSGLTQNIQVTANHQYTATVIVNSQTERTIQLFDGQNNNEPLLSVPFKGNVLSQGDNLEESTLGTCAFTTTSDSVTVSVSPNQPGDVIQIAPNPGLPDEFLTQFVVVSNQLSSKVVFDEVLIILNKVMSIS